MTRKEAFCREERKERGDWRQELGPAVPSRRKFLGVWTISLV